MKFRQCVFTGIVVTALAAVVPGMAASSPSTGGVPAQMVITVQPAHRNSGPAESLRASEVALLEGNRPVPVVGLERLTGDLADMQLFVLLDDATRSSSLGIQLPDLKTFIQSLPPTTQVAVGYMRNGTFALAQAFTADHRQAANALRLPMSIPGGNGSPYFALSDLVKHWPSKQPAGRRAVLMLTDGVDRYYPDRWIMDDPYVDAAIEDALKSGVTVYPIYLRGAGFYGRGAVATNFAQSRLLEVSQETGGYAYFQGFRDPVNIAPFLSDLKGRFDNQYRVTFEALNEHGVQTVKLRTELPGLKVEGPSRIYLP